MKRSEIVFGIFRILIDACAVSAALLLAYTLRRQNIDLLPGFQMLEPARTLPASPEFLRTFVIPATLLFILIAAFLKLYLIRVTLSFYREAARIALAIVVWLGAIVGWYFFIRKQLFYSRILLIHATLFLTLLIGASRIILTLLQRTLLRKGIGCHTVLSLGSEPLSRDIERFLRKDPRYRYLGQISSGAALRKEAENHSIDLVLQTDAGSSAETNAVIDFCRSHHLGYAFLPPVLSDVPHLLSVYRFGPVPILRFHPTPLDGWGAVYKRVTDILLASLLLILLAPFFILIALAITLDSRGPVFYQHKRMGQGGKALIPVLKFRSMVANADALKSTLSSGNQRRDGPLFKVKNDPRITRTGRVLRRFSLDELPQLWNVLRGDLSLIGPRPHLPEEVAKYSDFEHRVFAVKPGMTGLAQISGRSGLPFSEEVRLDLRYIEEWSPLLDLFIFFRTVAVVLGGKEAD